MKGTAMRRFAAILLVAALVLPLPALVARHRYGVRGPRPVPVRALTR